MSPKVLDQEITDRFSAYHGDSCEVIKSIPDNSIHFQVMSCPFSSLFVYSASDRDMGNSKDDAEFFAHYKFLIAEQLRVAMKGRLLAVHVMQLATSKVNHGFIGLRDFRGECIKMHVEAGWIYHSEVCIWKSPVTAAVRTKALGLLHKQIKKDSAMSRQGVADYLLVFRKPGENPEPVAHTMAQFPIHVWQRYASPVWATADEFDDEGFLKFKDPSGISDDEPDDCSAIDQTDVLQYRAAREHRDEKHLCVLQLPVIRRAVKLWSNPNDIVASWFMGVGSEGVVALKEGRRFVGCELKSSYYSMAVKNLHEACKEEPNLFEE